MIVKKSTKPRKLRIDLTGPKGNAFCLLAIAKDLARQNGLDATWPTIQKEMMSGNYENLLKVMDNYFGSIIILER